MRYMFDGFLTHQEIRNIEEQTFSYAVMVSKPLPDEWIRKNIKPQYRKYAKAGGSEFYVCEPRITAVPREKFSAEHNETYHPTFYFVGSVTDKVKILNDFSDIVIDPEPFKTLIEFRMPWYKAAFMWIKSILR